MGWYTFHLLASDPIRDEFGFVGTESASDACAPFGFSCARGSIYVTSVVPGSAAERARIPMSVIYDMEGESLDPPGLAAVRSRHKNGDMIPFLLVTPQGRSMRYWVRLGGP